MMKRGSMWSEMSALSQSRKAQCSTMNDFKSLPSSPPKCTPHSNPQRLSRRLAPLISLVTFIGVSLPTSAIAFCGFFVSGADAGLYNDATQVVLMRKGQRTVMSMSNTYKGPTEDFAMVVPVPVVLKKQQVKTLPANVFQRIDQLSAPRLVEYWEQDPCQYTKYMFMMEEGDSAAPRLRMQRRLGGSRGVKIEAQFSAGEYKILILSAREATGLELWLRERKYKIPEGASEALAPYIQQGMKFFVAKVDIKKVKRDPDGVVVLSPLRFDFESKALRLPVRLGLLNASGQQDLLVYILSPESRYEVANYKNVFIPTNLDVEDEVRKDFGGFYTRLFDETLALEGGRAVVTEYAWQTTSCDPCPTPPLTPSDLTALGGDVLSGLKASDAEKMRSDRSLRSTFNSSFSRWILTRLHTRYSAETLSEDLVFTPARPVRGGRGAGGINQEQPGAVELSDVNQFQGRYIIRHYWQGEVSCDEPRYGVWGGSGSKTQAPSGLGRAQKSVTALNDMVRSSLPRLKIRGKPEPAR